MFMNLHIYVLVVSMVVKPKHNLFNSSSVVFLSYFGIRSGDSCLFHLKISAPVGLLNVFIIML